MKQHTHRYLSGLALLCLAAASTGHAQPAVELRDAWVRPAYALPAGSGAYMTIIAAQPMRLTGASTDAARAARLGGTTLADGVMTMHTLPGGIDLPAGRAVVLEPGRQYIDLDGLKRPLATGDRVRIRLSFIDAAGRASQQDVEAPVRLVPPGQAEPAGHGGMHMQMHPR